MSHSDLYVPLIKPRQEEWKDLETWTKRCNAATGWEKTSDPNIDFHRGLKVNRRRFSAVINAIRSVELIPDIDFVNVKHTPQIGKPLDMSDEGFSFVLNISDIPELNQVPSCVWAEHKYDVGLIKGADPIVIIPKSSYRPCQNQYPLKKEAVEGIKPVFESLLRAGVIVPCEKSPVRTPIFPVRKMKESGQPQGWRFVQDLQAVNAAVQARAPNVPNPHTILSQVPSESKWFSVVDLSNAFFSIPIHPDSQFWFAFSFEGKMYTFTRLCQGYCESPTIFNAALRDNLESLDLPAGSALLQYVDDLMICSPTKETCVQDTVALLKHLATNGHKVSLSKMQFVSEKVTFLGHIITSEGKTLSSKRIEAIQTIPKPETKKQVMSFLGMTSYCRQWIPHYAEIEAPLSAIVYGKGLTANNRVTWTTEAEKAFVDLKLAMQSPPTLGLPDCTRRFTQTVDERGGYMTSVLLQDHGGRLRPVAYFSSRLDSVAAGLPTCLRAVAAAEKAVIASRDVVGYADLTLLVPHAVSMILLEQKTSHLSTARWLRYNTVLLEMPNITIKRCTVLNPATLLPTPGDGEPHDCVAVITEICSPRPDLQDVPLVNADMELFVDGSASRDPATSRNQVGFAVTTLYDTIIAEPLPSQYSAQAAELVALTEACKYARDKSVNIFTDSRYAWGVAHDFGRLWANRKFLTSTGKPITHHTLVAALLDAVLLPKLIAICKCEAHTRELDSVSRGNARADIAAKAAAKRSLPVNDAFVLDVPVTPNADLQELQARATPEEKVVWKKAGCSVTDGIWCGPDGKPCLPKYLFPYYAKLIHGKDHVSKGGMQADIQKYWFTKGFSNYSKKFCQKCVKDALPKSIDGELHDLKPGDWIVVKDLRRKSWRARRWNGPYQVLLTTQTAVKVAERATWVHASHCKRVPEPGEDSSGQNVR
ncbi:uncharacterized protein LOC132996313 [Limanda limanda]|uniref:uncharacterized protein LOC132996313 n=1 Tax=Limanda limanda TaxID=27771 RepID=UPI0029C6EA62|nr:uncharacterized protein LOC132996313 [Limanda limanda]